eukprot:5736038-Prymnesium_polylepis.1
MVPGHSSLYFSSYSSRAWARPLGVFWSEAVAEGVFMTEATNVARILARTTCALPERALRPASAIMQA